jgi:hypothetical protein
MREPTEKQRRSGSGGPKSPNGKTICSRNSLKHGCRSQNVLVPGESHEDYEQLWKTWLSRYTPTSPADLELIRLTVDAAWRMQRSERAYQEVEASLLATATADKWTDDQLRRLLLMQRYKTADANAFHKCVRLLETIRKNDLQYRAMSQRHATYLFEEAAQGVDYIAAKATLARTVMGPRPLPTTREDGGCECTPCLLEWGLLLNAKPKTETGDQSPTDESETDDQ